MSSTKNQNGTITLTSLAELGSVLDRLQLSEPAANIRFANETPHPTAGPEPGEPKSEPGPPTDLAGLAIELDSMRGTLESLAYEDARAREQAALDVARYEALQAEIAETE